MTLLANASGTQQRTGSAVDHHRSRLGALLAGIAAFVSLFRVGIPAAAGSLDGSWTAVLSWAFSHGVQFGKDLIFTYGPLGFLIPIANYHPQTFTLFFTAQVLLGLTWTLLIARFALRLRLSAQLALALLLFSWMPVIIIDVGWYLMFILAAVFVREDVDRGWSGALFGFVTLVALSVIALTKFTFLLLWLAFVGHLLLQLLLARRPLAAAAAAAIAASLLLGLWTAAGQQPESLALFLRNGLEISRAYASGMGLTPSIVVDVAGLAALALTAACLTPLLTRHRDTGLRVLGVFILSTLMLTWRAGYTRADSHACIFLGCASLIAFVGTASAERAAYRRWQPAAVGMISLGGLLLTYTLLGGVSTTLGNAWEFAGFSLDKLFAPERARAVLQASWQRGAQSSDLPASRRRIGTASVDLLMHEQGVVLLNEFNYAPRPLFQGYSAGSTQLARLNETALLGADGPRFLLLKFQTIDAHLPGNEDPLAQLAALRAYVPVDYEKGYVLLERSAPAMPMQQPPPQQWRDATFGEQLGIPPDSSQILFFHVELSLPGQLYSALFREPALGLQVAGEDGTKQDFRLVRSLGNAGTLISPLLPDNAAYLAWYGKQRELRPRAVRFIALAPALQNLFAPKVSYALQSVELPRKDRAELPESLRHDFYPGFSHLPRSQHSAAPMETVRNLGEDVVFMHAPSSVDFVLPAGRWRAEGKFGLSAGSYAPGVCPEGDGALFRVYRGASRPMPDALLYSRQFDPHRVESDRGALAFTLPAFDSDGTTPLTLEFLGGSAPSATAACDWTFLGPLRFVPEPATTH